MQGTKVLPPQTQLLDILAMLLSCSPQLRSPEQAEIFQRPPQRIACSGNPALGIIAGWGTPESHL